MAWRLALIMSGVWIGFWLAIFIPAARWDWAAGWVCWSVLLLSTAGTTVWLYFSNPELLWRRVDMLKGETPAWDPWILAGLHGTVGSQLVLASLERGQSGQNPAWHWWLLGLACYAVGYSLITASICANPFFESTVRYQDERQHRVIDQGPYARVRHPGYAGGLLAFLSLSCLLGSAWSLLGWFGTLGLVAVRALLEEDYLDRHLPGYTDYSQRVRYRIVPGLW